MVSISSQNVMNPTGGAPLRHMKEPPSLPFNLLEQILDRRNVSEAWKQVKANRGAPGVDGISVDCFPAYAREKWPEIKTAILEKDYIPLPAKRVEIPKANGGQRPLGIPTIQDRLIQQAIHQVLSPLIDPTFSPSSFGFRPLRSAHQAVKQIHNWYQSGYRIAVDIDLEKFFDTVNHDILMNRLARHAQDKEVLQLIGRYLRAGVVVKGRYNLTRGGVPQGGPLSPLLSNILLDDLDKELEKRGHKFARYADDAVILVKSKRAGERVMKSITRFLERKLKVKVNQAKSQVRKVEEITFLGFNFRGKKIWVSEKSVSNFKHRLRELTGRSWGVSMEYRLASLRSYIQGWMAYYAIGCKYNDAVEFDHWLRRRIRMCYWKRWKKPKTRIREMIKLGASKHQAILTGLSRKGYWHLAKTLSTNMGLSNRFLQEQGLVSIRQIWVKVHYPAKAR